MYTILITCAATILINNTEFPWNDHDNRVLARAKYVCSTDYRYKHAPCLKTLTKVGERDYNALCGARQ